MREIKIRGCVVDELIGSQCVYGTGVHTTKFTKEFAEEVGKPGQTFIFAESGWIEVYPESVGEYTGLKDKNGKEIYEKDIVKVEIPVVSVNEDFIGQVEMSEGRWWIDNGNDAIPLWSETNEITVLGNIYEDPELLEGLA